jgi:negative regulator of flagellin synthesis FlgM
VTTIRHIPDVIDPAGLSSGSAGKTPGTPGQPLQIQTQTEAQTAGSQSADVEITPAAQLLANVEQQLASIPDVNQSRVDSIRQALNSGSYLVDSGRVADGLLAAQRFDAQATGQFGSDPD